ncbi:hypothetical protein HOD61_02315 [archaeon]|jgi:hypothetical protein|nr:hypothetical protein [archaeon]
MNSNKYIPDYANGEILVSFYDMAGPFSDFPERIGTDLGFKLISPSEYGNNYIYQTKKGQEGEACERFMKNGMYVEYAIRRDLNLENKLNGLDNINEEINNLSNSVEKYPSPEFNNKIDLIKNLLDSIKY